MLAKAEADGNGHEWLCDGECGKREAEGTGVEGSLRQNEGNRARHEQRIRFPARQKVEQTHVEQMAGGCGESRRVAECHSGPGRQQDCGPILRGRVVPQNDGCGADRGNDDRQDDPCFCGGPGVADARTRHAQEERQTDSDGACGAKCGQRYTLVFASGRDGEGNDQTQDEERLDEYE